MPTRAPTDAATAADEDDATDAAEAEAIHDDSAAATTVDTAVVDANTNNNNAQSLPTQNDNAAADDNVPPPPPLYDTSIPPYSAGVTFNALPSYTPDALPFHIFYNGDADACPPVVLTTAGIGVPEFPDPKQLDNIETIQRVIKRNKSMLFDKSKVLTNSRSAKSYLQKEVIRRSILNNDAAQNNNAAHPAVKGWTCEKLIQWLKENPPPESEHNDINVCFNKLKEIMNDHYSVMSGSSDANMWRHVRLWECILDTSLRDDYKKRNDQHPRHLIDARNSSQLPKTYWEKVADLYNSAVVISSRILSNEYGEPFHEPVQLKQPSRENCMTAESVKNFFNKQRGAFITIRNNINASGNGSGSHTGNNVKDFTSARRNKKAVANGPATGYGYIAFDQEGEFDDYVSIARDDVGATMGKTPRINGSSTSTKRGSTGKSEESRKKSKSDHSEGAFNLLAKMNGAMSLEMKKSELDQIRYQISVEETSLLNHRKEIREARKELREIKKSLRDEGVSKEEMEEDDEYKCAMYDVTTTGNTMVEIEERIKKLKSEEVERENDYAAAKKSAEEEEQKNNSQVAEKDNEQGDDDVSIPPSNDGSRDVEDDDLLNMLNEDMDDDAFANGLTGETV